MVISPFGSACRDSQGAYGEQQTADSVDIISPRILGSAFLAVRTDKELDAVLAEGAGLTTSAFSAFNKDALASPLDKSRHSLAKENNHGRY